jgi:DNA processing protein
LRVWALRITDLRYPRLLREIALPPALLYVRGTLLPDDDWAVAIGGTRRATTYGRHVTDRLAGELAQQRVTVVSGLAQGIDTHAHTAALDAGGRTIAVLGCGPDLVYPPENARLAARIVEAGAVVTEFAPGTQPDAGNFPARNRLISGLSLGVVVTEAPEVCGALITTRFAAEQGRDAFAVPGNIYNRSSIGTNRLIQDGAKLVQNLRLPRLKAGESDRLPLSCFRLRDHRFTVRGWCPFRAVSGGPSTGRTQGFRWHRCSDHSGQPLGL